MYEDRAFYCAECSSLVYWTVRDGVKEIPIEERAATEVTHLESGGSVDVDTDNLAYPEGFSQLKPGDYQAQAVLDVDHTYNYSGRNSNDLISPVLALKAWTAPTARLERRPATQQSWSPAGRGGRNGSAAMNSK